MHQEFGRKLIVITQLDRPKGRKQHVQATPVKKACENLGIDVFTPKNIPNTARTPQITPKAWDQKEGYMISNILEIMNLHPFDLWICV